jgi:EAL domain-containing protein (putative c-di-GMP-specific phosphodiesterase class I)
MKLVTEDENGGEANFVSTTFFREIIYNAEHAIHHLALIRVALRVMKLDIVGDDFGMAYSTIKYLSASNKN